jgi:hypothetical protein
MDDLMEISVDADIGILYDDFMAMEEEYERSEPTGLVAADFPRHPPDDHLPRQVERQSSFEAPPQLAVAAVSDRDAATLDAVNLRESDAIFRDSFKQLAPLEVAAMIKSGEYNILFRTPKGEDKTMWHVQRATRAQFESIHKMLYTYRDLITTDIVFAIHHVATQAVLDALPFCTNPCTKLSHNGINVGVTKRRHGIRYKRTDLKFGISPRQEEDLALCVSCDSQERVYGLMSKYQFRLEHRVVTSVTTVRYECDRCCKRRVEAGLVPTPPL